MKFKALSLTACSFCLTLAVQAADSWPDGSAINQWFNDTVPVKTETLGKRYVVTDYGVVKGDSTLLQTEAIQRVIDLAAENGGGVVTIPEGVYLSGSLFFKPGTHLNITAGGRLKGSDAITNYKIVKTRLEGQTINYFAALINADGVDGFTITGPGTIDGDGWRFWDEFWLRRKVNPDCTNLEALRPRLVYISNSNDIEVSNVRLVNSGFWTNHLYRCNRVKYLNDYIWANTDGYPKGPSTDAIDLDVCSDVLIANCYMNVNDDAVCLKGGKGTFVDKDPNNGGNARILIEDCSFGKTNAGVTFGSEAWDCSNVIMRDCKFNGTNNMILFKMRPDTPQNYRNVLVENISGNVKTGFNVSAWTQFYNKLDRDDMPISTVDNIIVRNVDLKTTKGFYRNDPSDDYKTSRFNFSNITADGQKFTLPTSTSN
ncbi:MAG: glycosyl hydrolase family 28 protein [Clostridiales bacterium]|nr:glycosyl hydrolase family 28 protein [Clostridiales bacterium]